MMQRRPSKPHLRKSQQFCLEQLEQRLAMAATLSLASRAWSVFEGDKFEFTLTLSEPSKFPERVMVTTAPGTATYGSDYFAPPSTQILFSPGQISQTFSISTLRDAGSDKAEGPETFQVIATPANKALGTRPLAVVINDLPKEQPGFQITMEYDASVPASIKSLFNAAAARWSRVITGDLPAVKVVDDNGQTQVIDDLFIFARVQTLPNPNTIARAGFFDIRVGNTGKPAFGNFSQDGLPYAGQMTINSSFVNSPGIGNTIAHEMGHVLGFGSLWQRVGTYPLKVTGIGTADPRFLGSNAVREYNRIFGVTGTGVPLFERSKVTPPDYDGSYGSHWRDDVFNNAAMTVAASSRYFELMTAEYDPDTTLPNGQPIPSYLSSITVGAMADLGYRVNYAAADNNYRKPPPPSQALGVSASTGPAISPVSAKPLVAKPASASPAVPGLQGKQSTASTQPFHVNADSLRRNSVIVTDSRMRRPVGVVTVLTPPVLASLRQG